VKTRGGGTASIRLRRRPSRASAAGHAAIVPDSLVDRYAVAGTVTEVRDQLRRLLDTPGVDRVILNPQIVGPGAKPWKRCCRDFEREILPGLG